MYQRRSKATLRLGEDFKPRFLSLPHSWAQSTPKQIYATTVAVLAVRAAMEDKQPYAAHFSYGQKEIALLGTTKIGKLVVEGEWPNDDPEPDDPEAAAQALGA